MHEFYEDLRAFLGLSFAADRRGACLTLVYGTFGPLLAVGMSLALAALVARAVDGDVSGATVAAIIGCAMLALRVVSSKAGLGVSAAMVDRTGRLVDRRLFELLSAPRTLRHYDDPELLDKTALLRVERERLTTGADVLGLMAGTVLRLLITVVVAAAATPWLLLVPVAAVGGFYASRHAERVRVRAREDAAQHDRRAAGFFRVAVAPEHMDEFMLSRAPSFVLEQHAVAASEADRTRQAGLLRGLIWTTIAALLTAVALTIGVLALLGSASQSSMATTLGALLLLSSTTALVGALMGYVSACSESLRLTRTLRVLTEQLTPTSREVGGGGGVDSSQAAADRSAVVELKDVSFTYRSGVRPALVEVNLRLDAGTVYAVVGTNGSGKSTLVHIIAGLLDPDSGRVLRGGRAAETIPDNELYARTTIVAQDFARFEFPLEASVRLGDRDATETEMADAFADSGLRAALDAGELSLQTPIGASFGRDLSGGQWQRVAIARGLIRCDSRLVLLDEPTSAIDPIAEDAMLSAFVHRARSFAHRNSGAALIVTHRMSLVSEVDQVVFLTGGAIAGVGPHRQLLANPAYRRLYEAQSRAYVG